MSKRTFASRTFASWSFRTRTTAGPLVLYWRGPGNWSSASNWARSISGATGFGPPTSTTVVFFSGGLAENCTVDAGAVCYSMATVVGYNKLLDFASGGLVVTNEMIITAGTLLRGDSDLTVGSDFSMSGGSLLFDEAGSSPTWAVAGDFTVGSGIAGWSPTQLAGHTITVGGDLSLTGPAGLLNLVASSTWTLTVTGAATATNVNVAYSDASGGTEINATDESNTDSGNTLNWLFSVMATAGPDYTYPLDRQHYTLPPDDQHYQLPLDRQHYTIKRN